MRLYLKTEIEVNDKDDSRCSINCQHARKRNGNYQCLLYEESIDEGEDDDIGYGFKRTKGCLSHVIGRLHLGSFGGDL
jgi:hypothetical protein